MNLNNKVTPSLEQNRGRPVSTLLCILQKSSFEVPEDGRMEVVDLSPFLSTADSLHHESLAFSTVCFSQELKSSSTFRKHELHKQGAFLALRPVAHTPLAHISTLCLWVFVKSPLLFHSLGTDRFWPCLFSLDSFETHFMAGLEKGVARTFSHLELLLATRVKRLFLEKDACWGEPGELAGHLWVPQASGAGEWTEWTHPWAKHYPSRIKSLLSGLCPCRLPNLPVEAAF